MGLRINIGCGQTPTHGWRNFDNSLSLRLSKIPLLPDLLQKLGLIEDSQRQFIRFASENDIEYGDATEGLPIKDESVDVLYTSHMMEHLDKTRQKSFSERHFEYCVLAVSSELPFQTSRYKSHITMNAVMQMPSSKRHISVYLAQDHFRKGSAYYW